MSDYCDPRDLDGPARARYLEERGLALMHRRDGNEVSIYRGVHIAWTSTLDTRITLVIDAMPETQRVRLLSAYAHKGGCGFTWDGAPPVDYREGEMLTEDLVPDLNDSWYIDHSYDINPPAQLPNVLSTLPYDLYLESDHWKALRAKAIAHYGDTCVLCDKQPVQVHHRTYVRRGFERLTDLIVLCDDCHSRYHGKTA